MKTLIIDIHDYETLTVLCENHKNLEFLCLPFYEYCCYSPIYDNLVNLKHLFIKTVEYCNNNNVYYYKVEETISSSISNCKKLETLICGNYAEGLTPNYYNVNDLPNLNRFNILPTNNCGSGGDQRNKRKIKDLKPPPNVFKFTKLRQIIKKDNSLPEMELFINFSDLIKSCISLLEIPKKYLNIKNEHISKYALTRYNIDYNNI